VHENMRLFQEGIEAKVSTARKGNDVLKVERNMEKCVKVFKQSMVAMY
jgi:hypothetical protein